MVQFSKMKPLPTNKRVLTWLGIFPVSETAKRREKILFIVSPIAFITVLFIAIIGSAVFIVNNLSINMTATIYAFFDISSLIATAYMLLVGLVLRRKIKDIFTKLSGFYEDRKYLNQLKKNKSLLK